MLAAVAVVLGAALLAGCSTGSSIHPDPSGRLAVVAAEAVWGSIASQLGGQRVDVRSVIADPDIDPHDYEPTPSDARAIATANVVVVNGIGYDPWVNKLLSANPSADRVVVNVGDLVGRREGDNPHQWYSPTVVDAVVAAIARAYVKVDPTHRADHERGRDAFESSALGPYRAAIADIRARYAGTPVGASESIFAPMASALGLDLVTPAGFLDAISEGAEPTAGDKAVVDRQIATHAIEVFVFNRQNATPDVRRLVTAAGAKGIQVATVTETPAPRGATFQAWQTRQLADLRAALAAATGR